MPVIELRSRADLHKVANAVTKHVDKRMRKGLLSAAIRLVEHIKGELIPEVMPYPPVDMGMYRAGWEYAKTNDGAEVFNAVPHAVFIENGVSAANVKIGRKMIDALAAWARRKGLVSSIAVSASGKRSKLSSADQDQQARQLAWAIAKTMQKRGIFAQGKGYKIADKARQKVPQYIREEIRRAMQGP